MKEYRSTRKTLKRNFTVFGELRVLVCAALFAAMSIVCGKYLQIPVGEVVRISFENLPIIMSGILFGPVVGLVTGVVADLVGCLMVGYDVNPLVLAGAAAIGLLSGVVSNYFFKKTLWLRLLVSVVVSHLVGSVLIKTLGLAAWYSLPLYELMLWRLGTYVCIAAAEFAVILLLMKNRAFSSQLKKLIRD